MKIDFQDRNKVYIVAEIGMTHDGSFGLASKLTESAIIAGANVIFSDCDVESAVERGAKKVFLNSGQSCNAPTRMLVPKDRYDEAISICLLYTSPSPRDATLSRMPSSA